MGSLINSPPAGSHTYSRAPSPSDSGSINSPAGSLFSRGHSSRSSVSSSNMMSSPTIPRESLDLYGSAKRLEDVREEPLEREDDWAYADDYSHHFHVSSESAVTYPASSTNQLEYSLGDQDAWSTTSSGKHPFKRARSTTVRNSITDRVATRFGSISRKWKTRAVIGSQSAIGANGHHSRRSSSATSAQMLSPALSAISQYENCLPGSPIPSVVDESFRESAIVPLFMEDDMRSMEEEEQDEGQATTPLLPPTIAELAMEKQQILHSPLQSPAIAPTTCIGSARVSMENGATYLPSPPLSARPSMASLPRSPSALQNDIPPLTLYEEPADAWDDRLGHANFQIHPEPYLPEPVDVDSYREFRANWDLARKQFAQHIARTTEHYGTTSRVYKLTQQKWEEIDDQWKSKDKLMSRILSASLTRMSHEVNTPEAPSSPDLLEKPLTRVIVPAFDQSGKFPGMGDADIIGPLAVVPARAPELQRKSPHLTPSSPKKRNLFKYLSDVLARHNNGIR